MFCQWTQYSSCLRLPVTSPDLVLVLDDTLPWMSQRHLKISLGKTELLICSQTWPSFSVSYLSPWHWHPPPLWLKNERVILHTSRFLALPLTHHKTLYFHPCKISDLPNVSHLRGPPPWSQPLSGLVPAFWPTYESCLLSPTVCRWLGQSLNLIRSPCCIKPFNLSLAECCRLE